MSYEFLLKLGLALFLGLFIGIDRQLKNKPLEAAHEKRESVLMINAKTRNLVCSLKVKHPN